MQLPAYVQVNDVLLRDGLQLEEKLLTVEEKLELAEGLISAGVTSLEFGSFVHPKLVPQMANSGELFSRLKDSPADFVALVPNVKGAENASEAGVPRVNVVFSASNTHNLQNIRQTTEESLENVKKIKAICDARGMKLDISIATSFGCPFEGRVPEERIFSIIASIAPLEPQVITLADTTGVANPKQVYDLVNKLQEKFPHVKWNLHFHDTRGMGLANILAGLQAGVTSFDASLGGLGGCPFAPGATGNVSTEDVVHMFHSMGIETGIDLDKLLETSRRLKDIIGHELSSSVLKAGKYDRKYPVPS